MSDFAKEKIAFAIGLLAVLFTLTPLIDSVGGKGFQLLGIAVTLRLLYEVMAVALGVSVYAYGIQFLTERRLRATTLIGDAFYAIAVASPLLFGGLFLAAEIAHGVAVLAQSSLVRTIVQATLSIASVVTSGLLGYSFRSVLARKQKVVDAARRSAAEFGALHRAEELYEAQFYDLAVVEAFKALELAARGLPGVKGKNLSQRDWLEPIMDILPTNLRRAVDQVRRLRNAAAHTNDAMTAAVAKDALAATSKVLALLSDIHSEQCPNCGKTGMIVEDGSDHGFTWQRRRCPHCGFLDLD